MTVIELPDDDGTGFDAGDLGTAWLPYTEPRAQDLEQLAIALIQHAATMPQGDHTTDLEEIADEYRTHCLAVGDFMRATHAAVDKAENFLVSA